MRAYEAGFEPSERTWTNTSERLPSIRTAFKNLYPGLSRYFIFVIHWMSNKDKVIPRCIRVALYNIAIPFAFINHVVHSCVWSRSSARLGSSLTCEKRWTCKNTWTSEWSENESRLKPDLDRANEREQTRMNNLLQWLWTDTPLRVLAASFALYWNKLFTFMFARARLLDPYSCFAREQMLLLRRNREHNVTYTITQQR